MIDSCSYDPDVLIEREIFTLESKTQDVLGCCDKSAKWTVSVLSTWLPCWFSLPLDFLFLLWQQPIGQSTRSTKTLQTVSHSCSVGSMGTIVNRFDHIFSAPNDKANCMAAFCVPAGLHGYRGEAEASKGLWFLCVTKKGSEAVCVNILHEVSRKYVIPGTVYALFIFGQRKQCFSVLKIERWRRQRKVHWLHRSLGFLHKAQNGATHVREAHSFGSCKGFLSNCPVGGVNSESLSRQTQNL